MFNSIASYLWGASEAEHGSISQQQQQQQSGVDIDGEHLNTQADEDWVVVGTGQDGLVPSQEEELEHSQEEEDSDVASHGVEVAQPARARALHAAHHVMNATPQRLLKESQKAQVVRHLKAQKGISRQKCDRENKVYHTTTCSKKGQNKHNKRVKPAGSKAARVTQRM